MEDEEPDVRIFFRKIVISLLTGLMWLFINSTLGIGLGLAYFNRYPTLGNYLFYAWFLLSLFLLLLFYKKKWDL
jgi:hypothetical protein